MSTWLMTEVKCYYKRSGRGYQPFCYFTFGKRRKFLSITFCSVIFIEVSAHAREEINNISYSLF